MRGGSVIIWPYQSFLFTSLIIPHLNYHIITPFWHHYIIYHLSPHFTFPFFLSFLNPSLDTKIKNTKLYILKPYILVAVQSWILFPWTSSCHILLKHFSHWNFSSLKLWTLKIIWYLKKTQQLRRFLNPPSIYFELSENKCNHMMDLGTLLK